MDLTVISPPPSGSAARNNATAHAGLLKPGMFLTARVVQLQSDGKALLDFGRFRAEVETDSRWQPGDVLRFQVASDRGRLPLPGPTGAFLPGQPLPVIRLLLSPPEASTRETPGRVPSHTTPPQPGDRSGGAVAPDAVPNPSPAHPMAGALRWKGLLDAVAGWVARHSTGVTSRSEVPGDRKERFHHGDRGGEAIGRRAAAGDVERGLRAVPPAWQQAFDWEGGQVMLKIFERPAAGRRGGRRVRTSILTVTRQLGAVRVDLAWSGRGTGISFFVAAEATASYLRAALGDLRQALEACGQSVQLRVTVSPSRIEAFDRAERHCRGRRISSRGV